MTAVLFTPEWMAPRAARLVPALVVKDEDAPMFTAEYFGAPWPEVDEPARVELVLGERRIEVRGDCDFFTGREPIEIHCDGEPFIRLDVRSTVWRYLAKEREIDRSREEARAWLLSQCPPQYLNARPFIRWMRDLYRDGQAHGADLATAFAEFFGCPPGASEYAQFAAGVAFHEAGAFGFPGFAKLVADGATCSAEGHDAARLVLERAMLGGWLEQDGKAQPMPWQNNALTRLSSDSYAYRPTEKSAWRDAPAWLDDIVHFMPAGRVT